MMSPLQKVCIDDHEIYIKRDDLITDIINGNKARKLKFLIELETKQIKKVVSFGGIQSNFMLALAKLAHAKNWAFDYYVKSIPKQLQQYPIGNYYYAIEHDINLTSIPNEPLTIKNIHSKYQDDPRILILDQGGRQQEAELGFIELSKEIKQQVKQQKIDNFAIFIPSGTGISAYFLQKHLYPNVVYTTPCVGSKTYLIQQIQQVDQFDPAFLPTIFESKKKFHFGKPDIELLSCHQKLLNKTSIEFDLLYDPIGWITLLENINKISQTIIFIHCGGIEGNESMLKRYNHLLKKIQS